jgi:hypothetical protein
MRKVPHRPGKAITSGNKFPDWVLSGRQVFAPQMPSERASELQNVKIETPEPSQPGMAERAIDTATDVSRTLTEVSEALQAAAGRLSDAIAAARRPGMPLATISAITREAPLASLFVAFLFGVAIARRR